MAFSEGKLQAHNHKEKTRNPAAGLSKAKSTTWDITAQQELDISTLSINRKLCMAEVSMIH
jgi:hypothetical protein